MFEAVRRWRAAYTGRMGEVTVLVKLTNYVDRELADRGQDIVPRTLEIRAVVDTGAVRSVIPASVAEQLGVRVRPGRMTTLADGRQVSGGVAQGIVFEIMGREAEEEAIVLGNEVLIGQTTLESTDLVVDCRSQEVRPNPEHPDGPVWKVR